MQILLWVSKTRIWQHKVIYEDSRGWLIKETAAPLLFLCVEFPGRDSSTFIPSSVLIFFSLFSGSFQHPTKQCQSLLTPTNVNKMLTHQRGMSLDICRTISSSWRSPSLCKTSQNLLSFGGLRLMKSSRR